MSEAMQIALITAAINGAVTWGIITTKLAWIRRDLDEVRDFVFKRKQCEVHHGA